jgi:hypothetical protein
MQQSAHNMTLRQSTQQHIADMQALYMHDSNPAFMFVLAIQNTSAYLQAVAAA